ncbi:MAG: glycosyltransferase [Chloroflexi bacterium]|nr:glycosyltransferase [Chloroflexota bacterium]
MSNNDNVGASSDVRAIPAVQSEPAAISAIYTVSIIICTRNRSKLLRGTVEAILRGSDLPDEIVVIDQSDPPLADLAGLEFGHNCQIRHLPTSSLGLGRARNVGIRAARGDILVLIDDDVLVERQWFRTMTEALRRAGPKSAVSGRILPGLAPRPGGFAPSVKVDEEPATYRGRVDADVLYTNNMGLFRSAFDEVGLFDDRLGAGSRFPSSEDNDFGYRLLEAGYTILYVPEAVVYHLAWRSSRDFVPLRWDYGRGQGAFYAKHLGLRDRYMLRRMARHLITPLTRFAQRARGKDLRGLAGDLVFSAGLLAGSIEWLATQSATRAGETGR